MNKQIAVFTTLALLSGVASATPIPQPGTESYLMQMAEQINPQLPMTSATGLRWDRVDAGPGRRLNYRYTYTNHPAATFNKMAWRSKIEPEMRNVCQLSDMIPLFKSGVTAAYTYTGRDGALVGSFEVTPNMCGY